MLARALQRSTASAGSLGPIASRSAYRQTYRQASTSASDVVSAKEESPSKVVGFAGNVFGTMVGIALYQAYAERHTRDEVKDLSQDFEALQARIEKLEGKSGISPSK